MGYTQYWNGEEGKQIDREALKKALAHMAKIIEDNKDILAGGMGDGEPVANEDEVWFNGKEGDGFETFHISVEWNGEFSFCKTGRREYDKVVVACLIALKYYLGDSVKISSDGIFTARDGELRIDPELAGACEFAMKYFPKGQVEDGREQAQIMFKKS